MNIHVMRINIRFFSAIIDFTPAEFIEEIETLQNISNTAPLVTPKDHNVFPSTSTEKENLETSSQNKTAPNVIGNYFFKFVTKLKSLKYETFLCVIRKNIKYIYFLVPTRRRLKTREPIRKNALSYLNEKFERENIIKKRELELQDRLIAVEEKKIKLEERRLVLDEEWFDLEYKERFEKLSLEKQKIEIDLKEKSITQQLLEAQQQFIRKLVEKVPDNYM